MGHGRVLPHQCQGNSFLRDTLEKSAAPLQLQVRFAFRITAEHLWHRSFGTIPPVRPNRDRTFARGLQRLLKHSRSTIFTHNSFRYRPATEERHDRVETYTITMNSRARMDQPKQLPKKWQACRGCPPLFLHSSSVTNELRRNKNVRRYLLALYLNAKPQDSRQVSLESRS